MSWFDATGLANIAKSALKEAQKTIDKALDIRDDVEETDKAEQKPAQDAEGSDFFASWGLNEKQKNARSDSMTEVREAPVRANTMPSSIWGSFTGSFFEVENAKTASKEENFISTQPQKFTLLFPKDTQGVAPLATPENELTPIDITSGFPSKYSDVDKPASLKIDKINIKGDNNGEKKLDMNFKRENNGSTGENSSSQGKIGDDGPGVLIDEKVIIRPKARRNSSNRSSYISNRLSVISTESEGKRSSESVEVLGSLSCTTSPDTDLPSISASSSMGLPASSSYTDSVEVIDSLASPSSVEVIVDSSGSGRTTQSSLITSPKDESIVNQYSKELIMISSPVNSLTDVSPESVEVIPEINDLDEELSIADSYTSASESTGATVLEPPYSYAHRMTESITDLSQASSRFRSGDSTPDLMGKLPLTNRNSCDFLSDSIHQFPGLDMIEMNLPRKLHNDHEPKDRHGTPEGGGELENRMSRSMHGSPTRKPMSKSEEKINWGKPERTDMSKSEVVRTYSLKRDSEEGMSVNSSELLSLEEVSGSVSSQSDTRTVVAIDSSCEDTNMESSSEDAATSALSEVSRLQEGTENVERREEKIEQVRNQSNSFYVKNLLAEAMGEDSMTRETSPTLSEKSRSDLVKVGSEQTSGQTSGDELETTSSDIEIISRYSPNGDSSSTTSRHSPAKLLHHNLKGKLSLVAVDILGKATQSKTKGHQREPSEASSFCSEDNSSEVEKLSKRVTELTEILEARESKLVDLSRSHLEMQEKNQELKKQVEQAKMEVATRPSAGQSDAVFAEKDEIIRELREEGEKLSKTQLKQSTLIKTLRTQEKTQQTTLTANKKQIESLSQQLEQIRMKLASKEEIERSQIDNINQLTNKINRQDKEIVNLMDQMEKAVVKAEELRLSLDRSEVELDKCRKQLALQEAELREVKVLADAKVKQLARLREFQDSAQETQEGLLSQLEDLRQQLKNAEEMYSRREAGSIEEVNSLMRRLQEVEGRNEELSQSVSMATRPLLRQMEALQASTSHERETWEKQERNLLQKLEEAEDHLSSVLQHEKTFKQETLELRTRVSSLESQLQNSLQENLSHREEIVGLKLQFEETKQARESERVFAERQQEALRVQITELKREVTMLEHQLSIERAAIEAERRRTVVLQEQLKEKEAHPAARGDSTSPRSSPTLSFGRVSLSESLSSNWPQFNDDAFETASVSGRCSNVYESLRMGNTTSLIEGLQAQLKMRDGEVSQLQWELQRRDTERASLTAELSALTTKIEEQQATLSQADVLDKNLKELQTNYDALLEMYGEKVEEADELRLDLQDVKDMYKTQIDQLLNRGKQQDVPS